MNIKYSGYDGIRQGVDNLNTNERSQLCLGYKMGYSVLNPVVKRAPRIVVLNTNEGFIHSASTVSPDTT